MNAMVALGQTELSFTEATDIFKSINTKYLSMNHYSIYFERALYPNEKDSTIKSIDKGFMAYDNGKEYNEFQGVLTIQDQKYRIIVDSLSESITILDPKPRNKFIASEIENTLKSCKKIEINKSEVYTISMQLKDELNLPYSKIEIEYNPKTFLLNRITIFLKETNKKKSKIVITYLDQSKKTQKNYFDTSKYIAINNHIIKPTGFYFNYKLYNNLIK